MRQPLGRLSAVMAQSHCPSSAASFATVATRSSPLSPSQLPSCCRSHRILRDSLVSPDFHNEASQKDAVKRSRLANHSGFCVLATWKRCREPCRIWETTEVPSVPGLEITGSRVKSLPPEQRRRAEKTSKVSSVKVEIDIKAAGQEGTYEFVCSGAPGGTVFVTPTGVSGRYPLESSPARPIGNSPR